MLKEISRGPLAQVSERFKYSPVMGFTSLGKTKGSKQGFMVD